MDEKYIGGLKRYGSKEMTSPQLLSSGVNSVAIAESNQTLDRVGEYLERSARHTHDCLSYVSIEIDELEKLELEQQVRAEEEQLERIRLFSED